MLFMFHSHIGQVLLRSSAADVMEAPVPLHLCPFLYGCLFFLYTADGLTQKPLQHGVGGFKLQLQGCRSVKPVMGGRLTRL